MRTSPWQPQLVHTDRKEIGRIEAKENAAAFTAAALFRPIKMACALIDVHKILAVRVGVHLNQKVAGARILLINRPAVVDVERITP